MTRFYGLHVRFTAKPAAGDELEAILLRAAQGVRDEDRCRLYMVSRSAGAPETVWVTEAWTDREAHDAALQDDAAKAVVQEAMPLLAEPPVAVELRPAGGKGLT